MSCIAVEWRRLLNRSSRGKFTSDGFCPGLSWEDVPVLCVGAGGLGCEVLHCLGMCGFKNIHIIDMDTIDLTNLNRQFLFYEEDIGQPKAVIAAKRLMERVSDIVVTPHVGRVEDKSASFYSQFPIIILGLDTIVARYWMNRMVVSLVTWTYKEGKYVVESPPILVDGGTEGYRGSTRAIIVGRTSCLECYDFFPPTTAVPMCTLEVIPRSVEHCVLYVKEKLWGEEKPFGDEELDGDRSEHIQWVVKKAKNRQEDYQIHGSIDYAFAMGVVKNVMPAVGFTNALIAAQCVHEALKWAAAFAQPLDNFSFYDGNTQPCTSYVERITPNPQCSVCTLTALTVPRNATARDALDIWGCTLRERGVEVNLSRNSDVFMTGVVGSGGSVDLLFNSNHVFYGSAEEADVRDRTTLAKHFGEGALIKACVTGGSLRTEVFTAMLSPERD